MNSPKIILSNFAILAFSNVEFSNLFSVLLSLRIVNFWNFEKFNSRRRGQENDEDLRESLQNLGYEFHIYHKTWNGKFVIFVFSSKGIPSTPSTFRLPPLQFVGWVGRAVPFDLFFVSRDAYYAYAWQVLLFCFYENNSFDDRTSDLVELLLVSLGFYVCHSYWSIIDQLSVLYIEGKVLWLPKMIGRRLASICVHYWQ